LLPLRRSRVNHRECLTLWQKRTSKNGGDGETSVYMWEGTTSRMMAANRPYGEFYDCYSISPEYFEYRLILTHVVQHPRRLMTPKSINLFKSCYRGQTCTDDDTLSPTFLRHCSFKHCI
jgi:hypothetical protein